MVISITTNFGWQLIQRKLIIRETCHCTPSAILLESPPQNPTEEGTRCISTVAYGDYAKCVQRGGNALNRATNATTNVTTRYPLAISRLSSRSIDMEMIERVLTVIKPSCLERMNEACAAALNEFARHVHAPVSQELSISVSSERAV